MVNRSYRIGYNFERRVIKWHEDRGYIVVRSGKSKFPDFVAIRADTPHPGRTIVVIGECKVNKYLSGAEKCAAKIIYEKTGVPLTVFYREGRELKSYVIIAPPDELPPADAT